MRLLKLLFVLLVCAAGAAVAGPLEDGLVAYQGRDWKTAVALLMPLAEQGDALARFSLGILYRQGKGVPKDVVQAYKWFDLATVDDGEYEPDLFTEAKQSRDDLASQMSPGQIAEARKLAQEWKPR